MFPIKSIYIAIPLWTIGVVLLWFMYGRNTKFWLRFASVQVFYEDHTKRGVYPPIVNTAFGNLPMTPHVIKFKVKSHPPIDYDNVILLIGESGFGYQALKKIGDGRAEAEFHIPEWLFKHGTYTAQLEISRLNKKWRSAEFPMRF